MRTTVTFNARIQRVLAGGLLIGLNTVGLASSPDWLKWAALVLQLELVATGLAGWCHFIGVGVESAAV
ncbi:MAG: hypothetical protein IH988_02605 [Planctomycetes bacterium]|nr:hypothetical protein [Planctomycetota bacterium]